MATNHANNEQDFLRARFTSWLDTVLYHAKLRYLHNKRQKMETVRSIRIGRTYRIPKEAVLDYLRKT